MSEEVIQLLGIIILAVFELYTVRAHDYPVFAKFWDTIARITGAIAKFFADLAMSARLSYWEAVNP